MIFNVDDLVMLYHPQQSSNESYKFRQKFTGPYSIKEKHDSVVYTIESEDKKKIYKVHVQRLIPYKSWDKYRKTK